MVRMMNLSFHLENIFSCWTHITPFLMQVSLGSSPAEPEAALVAVDISEVSVTDGARAAFCRQGSPLGPGFATAARWWREKSSSVTALAPSLPPAGWRGCCGEDTRRSLASSEEAGSRLAVAAGGETASGILDKVTVIPGSLPSYAALGTPSHQSLAAAMKLQMLAIARTAVGQFL